MPADPLPAARRLLAGVLLLAFIGIAVGVYAFAGAANDRLRLRTSLEEQRRLGAQTTLLKGEITKLKGEMAKNTAFLENKQQELEDAERLRLEMAKKQLQEKEAEEKRNELLASMRNKIASVLTAEDGAVFMENGRITIRLANSILFNSGEAKLRDQGREALKATASLLASPGLAEQRIVVEGHTDNEPIGEGLKWKFPSNWDLSAARASAAVEYLQGEGQIAPGRLTVVGCGETRPIASNDDAEGRARNRRIDIIIDLEQVPAPPSG